MTVPSIQAEERTSLNALNGTLTFDDDLYENNTPLKIKRKHSSNFIVCLQTFFVFIFFVVFFQMVWKLLLNPSSQGLSTVSISFLF